jgi:hypothetical protein
MAMKHDTEITITPQKLAVALQLWDEEAKNANWPPRDDTDRFYNSAVWLIGKIEGKRSEPVSTPR